MSKNKQSRYDLEQTLIYLKRESKLYKKRNQILRKLLERKQKQMLKRTPELRMLRRKVKKLEKLLNKLQNSNKSKGAR